MPHRAMPRATTRQDAPLVELSGDGPHAGEPLGAQVIDDGPQVCRSLIRDSHSLLIADLPPLSARAALGLPSFTPRALAAVRAALVPLTDAPLPSVSRGFSDLFEDGPKTDPRTSQ
jgi:hypothetical protein